MRDLVWRDAWDNRQVWFGAGLVAAATALFTTSCFNFLFAVWSAPDSVFLHPDGQRDDMLDVGANLLIYSGLPAVLVLSIVLRTLVTHTRGTHALWRLGGATPRQVLAVFTMQAVVACGVGAVIGGLATVPLQPTVNTLLTRGSAPAMVTSLSPLALVSSVLLVMGAGAVAAILPARKAARTSPINGRADDRLERRWVPSTLALLAFVIFVQLPLLGPLIADDRLRDPLVATLALLPAGQALVITVALLARRILAPVMRAWTAIPGLTSWTPWRIARHTAVTRAEQSASTVLPLMIGIGLFACFNVLGTVARNAAGREGPAINLFDGTLMLAPVGVIGAVGSAAVVFMATRRRAEDLTALRAAGASPASTYTLFACESLIYVVTAALLATVPVGLQLLLLHLVLGRTGVALDLSGVDLGAALAVMVLGGLATVCLVTTTGAIAWRRPLVAAQPQQ